MLLLLNDGAGGDFVFDMDSRVYDMNRCHFLYDYVVDWNETIFVC